MATQTPAPAGPDLPDRRVTEREATVLARPAHAGGGHRRTAGRGGARRRGQPPESRRRRGAGRALRPDLYRQRPGAGGPDPGRPRAGPRHPAVRPLPRHHPRLRLAVGQPVHQAHRGLHPDPQPGIGAGQGQRRRRQPDRDRRRGRLAGRKTPPAPSTPSTTTPSSSPSRPRPPSGTSPPATPTPATAKASCRCATTPMRSPAGCRPRSPRGSRRPGYTSSSRG